MTVNFPNFIPMTASPSVVAQTEPKKPKPLLTGKNTGYAAMAGMGLTMLTGMTRNKTMRSSHLYMSFLTATAAVVHLAKVLDRKPHPPHYTPKPPVKA